MEKVVLSLMFVHQLDMHAISKLGKHSSLQCFSELWTANLSDHFYTYFITYKIMHTFNPSI